MFSNKRTNLKQKKRKKWDGISMCTSKNKKEYFNSKPFNFYLTWNYSYMTFSTNFNCLFFTFTSFAKKKKNGVWRNTLIVIFLALKSKICDNWLTKQILFLRNIFQNHPSEKIFGLLNFHLFSYFLGFRIWLSSVTSRCSVQGFRTKKNPIYLNIVKSLFAFKSQLSPRGGFFFAKFGSSWLTRVISKIRKKTVTRHNHFFLGRVHSHS